MTPWTVARQAPLSMGFSRQEYWNELPFPSPGDLPNSGTEPRSPALQVDSLPTEPPGKLTFYYLKQTLYICKECFPGHLRPQLSRLWPPGLRELLTASRRRAWAGRRVLIRTAKSGAVSLPAARVAPSCPPGRASRLRASALLITYPAPASGPGKAREAT